MGIISMIELPPTSKIFEFEMDSVTGTLYSDWKHQMASDAGLILTDAFRHKKI